MQKAGLPIRGVVLHGAVPCYWFRIEMILLTYNKMCMPRMAVCVHFPVLMAVVQGVSIEKLEDLYASAMDYGITLVTISHEPGTMPQRFLLY